MKTVNALVSLALIALPFSFANAAQLNGYSGDGVSISIDANGSAEIQLSCSFISIAHFDDNGTMTGEEGSALPSTTHPLTKVKIKTELLQNGNLELTIGNGTPVILKPGFQPSVICG